MNKVINILNNIEIDDVLDIATGRGQFIQFLMKNLKNYNTITGVDNHSKSIQMARESFSEYEDVNFIEKNFFELDPKNHKYDAVSVSNSLHHFANPEKCLNKALSLLKQNGYFIISEMHRNGEQSESQKTHIMFHHWSAEIDNHNGVTHYRTFTHEKLIKLTRNLDIINKKVLKFSYPYDKKNQKEIKSYLKKAINKKLESIDKNENIFKKMEEKKNRILDHLDEYGFASSEMTFIIGRKR